MPKILKHRLEYSWRCEYINNEEYDSLIFITEEVGKLINYMILNSEKFGVKPDEFILTDH